MPGHHTDAAEERSKRSRSILLQGSYAPRGFSLRAWQNMTGWITPGIAGSVAPPSCSRPSSPPPRWPRWPSRRSASTPSRRARRQSPLPRAPRTSRPQGSPPRSRTPRPRLGREHRCLRRCALSRRVGDRHARRPDRSTPARGSTAASSSRTLTLTISYPVTEHRDALPARRLHPRIRRRRGDVPRPRAGDRRRGVRCRGARLPGVEQCAGGIRRDP